MSSPINKDVAMLDLIVRNLNLRIHALTVHLAAYAHLLRTCAGRRS